MTPWSCSRTSSGTWKRRGVYSIIERVYLALLDWSMAHRWVIISLMFVVFLSMLLPKIGLFTLVDKTFLPYDDEGQFAVNVRAPEGASVATTVAADDRPVRAAVSRPAERVREYLQLLGIVVLFGIVKKNSILQVDHPQSAQYDQLRKMLDNTTPLVYRGSNYTGTLYVVDEKEPLMDRLLQFFGLGDEENDD